MKSMASSIGVLKQSKKRKRKVPNQKIQNKNNYSTLFVIVTVTQHSFPK
jgi:hypothetical protein